MSGRTAYSRLNFVAKGIALLLLAAAASANEVGLQPSAAASASDKTPLIGLLTVFENTGCADTGSDAVVAKFQEGNAVFTRRLWLNSRISVAGGPIRISRVGKQLRAEVKTAVTPINKNEVVSTCLRPVELILQVRDLPEDDYQLEYVRSVDPRR